MWRGIKYFARHWSISTFSLAQLLVLNAATMDFICCSLKFHWASDKIRLSSTIRGINMYNDPKLPVKLNPERTFCACTAHRKW